MIFLIDRAGIDRLPAGKKTLSFDPVFSIFCQSTVGFLLSCFYPCERTDSDYRKCQQMITFFSELMSTFISELGKSEAC